MADYEDEREIDRLGKLVGRLEKALRDKIAELERESLEHWSKECRYLPGDAWCSSCEKREYAVEVLKALSAQPEEKPLGDCACGKPATESWGGIAMCEGCLKLMRDAAGVTDKLVSDLIDKITGKPAGGANEP